MFTWSIQSRSFVFYFVVIAILFALRFLLNLVALILIINDNRTNAIEPKG